MQTPPKPEEPSFEERVRISEARTQEWESNHIAITQAICWLIRQNERWPTKTEIAEESKLSRPTVYVHLKDFRQEDLVGAEMGELKYMASKILAKLTEKAMDGDVKSMRLSFELMGILKKGKSAVSPDKQG
jgi:DNA-binding transcriptional ArsR family regulator